MESVTISPKFQVVIPLKIRQALHLKPGQKVQVVQYEGRVELVPIQSMSRLRGFVRGMKTHLHRDLDRV
jgi:AbrB family looped-hinge helix DNA binding protein